ncbi:MAG: ABC transporter permease, partial [Candidatus Marinimicrobia bacterium]|nr:ABC transporter permease [Candidatus Neomarinimicrobiota bacterium]
MLKNYLKIAWRHLVRQKKYSLITILGLSVGVLCSLLISLYVVHELSYDSFHENSDRIYRLTNEVPPSDLHFARCPQTWVNHLPDEYPEVEQLVRFQTSPLIEIKSGEQKFRMEDVFKTDAYVFDVFSFPLVQGNPVNALAEPNSVVLSQNTARKMFG